MTPEEILSKIDDEQKKKAILTYQKDGKYLIIAGPGTGKTYTVSKRIEAILSDEEKGTTADRILCLTFSDTASKEMLKGLIDNKVPDAESVNIYTFHSFCMNLMEQYNDIFKIENKSLISPIQKKAVVKQCLDYLEGTDNYVKYLRDDNSLYSEIDDIVSGIEAIKHNRLTPEMIINNLEENIMWKPLLKDYNEREEELKNDPLVESNYPDEEKFKKALNSYNNKIAKLKNDKENHNEKINQISDLLNIFEEYKKRTKNFIDYDDMINLVLEEFERNPVFLHSVATSYDYILVDEYQDTNKSQNDIVFKLAEHCRNIFVVGDDDQIIYAFQGASLDTIKNFKEKLQVEKDNIIPLEQNRRSTPVILKVAEELAKLQDKYPLKYAKGKNKPIQEAMKNKDFKLRFMPKNLCAYHDTLKDEKNPVIINKFSDEKQERIYITNQIKEIILDDKKCPKDEKGNKKLSEIAVLTKTNADAYKYANKLKEKGIRVQLTGGKNIFEINSIKVLIAYMKFLTNPAENKSELYKYLLYNPFHINPKDYKILHSKEVKDLSGGDLIGRIKTAIELSEIEEKKQEKQNQNIILTSEGKEKFKDFIETYDSLTKYISAESIRNSIIQTAHKTGIYRCYMSTDINRTENIGAINRLLDEADTFEDSQRGLLEHDNETEKLTNFKNFVSYLNTLISANIQVTTDKTDKPLNAVQVSTLHSSKGREFEYVFMPSLNCRKFESTSKNEYSENVPKENAEITTPDENLTNNIDRIADKNSQVKFINSAKLIYVGMTRAKHYINLSYQVSEAKNPASWFIVQLLEFEKEREEKNPEAIHYIDTIIDENLLKEEPTDFDKKIDNAFDTIKKLKEHIHIDPQYENEINDALLTIEDIQKVLGVSVGPDEATKLDYDYAAEFSDYILSNIPQKHSASSLNTYIDCPKKYLYQYVLHLAPEKNTDEEEEEKINENNSTEWGIIFHYALEYYVRDAKNAQKHLSFDVMEKYFDEKQQELIPIDDHENNPLKQTINIKKEHLRNYYNILLETPASSFNDVEKSIPDEIKDKKDFINIKGFNFSGKIDRIDEITKGHYRIIDYKTGTKKSNVKEEAKIDGKYEKIYNQLAFYKYVLKEFYNMTVDEVGIEFPEEPENSFTIDELSGEKGFENCKLVIDKYIEILSLIKEAQSSDNKCFECKKKCSKDKYSGCSFYSFCSSEVF